MSILTRALLGTTTITILAAPLPALAHASLKVASAPANSTFQAVLRLSHGCDGQPTHTVAVTIPEGFIAVKPMPKAGWTLQTVEAPYAHSYELHGEEVSAGVTEVRWTGGSLPDASPGEFVFHGSVTDFAPGTVLPFKAVQTCADGEVAWTELAAAGQDPHDLPHPAPTLTIAQAGGHDGSSAHDGGSGHDGHGAAAAEAAGPLVIETGWMRQPPPGAKVAGGYMTITNNGQDADRLLGGSVAFAGRVEIHEMAMDKGMMQMREVEGGLEIPAGGTVELKPGSYHVMIMDFTGTPPKAGETVPITLEFEKAGTVATEMAVGSMGANTAPAHGAMHHKAN